MLDKVYKYINDVETGKIKTGIEIKQAVARFRKDLKNKNYYFNEDQAIKALKFISHLKHFTGSFDNKNFILEGWQSFIIANIFGWYNKEKNIRRFTNAYISVSRKNGKTALAAAISLYCLIADGEANSEVILAANSREQAHICFDSIYNFSKKLDPKSNYLRAYRSEVKFNNNKIKVVASDSTKLDGLNPNCVILDEYHAAKTSQVYDVLKSAQVMREQPLMIIITTAGFNKFYPCYSLETTAKEVLQCVKDDESQFIAIFNLDVKDNWKDPKNWIKSNPNLGITVIEDSLKDEIQKAINNISLEIGVKTKNLNMWCDTLETWIADRYILESNKTLSINDIDEDTELFVGVDLSSVNDITSVSYMWFQNDMYNFITKYYLPEDSLNSATDKEYYKAQYKKNNIKLVPGNVVDYDIILNDILEVSSIHGITKLFYDSWNSTQFIINTTPYINCESFSQTVGNFNRPTKEFERLILQNHINIDTNDITRWMLSNVYLKIDTNGNVRPDKSMKSKKIDGVISMLMCMGGFLNQPRWNVTIF